MACRFCETEQRLVKAHIIPAGFFRVLRDASGALEVHTNKAGAHPRRAPIGVYDKSILCRPCDNVFSPWDKHAQDVLLRDFSDETAIYAGSVKLGWTISKFNYRLLKLFFLSLVWRASVSAHPFYRRVSTGPFEQELRKMIAAGEPGAPGTFAVTLARFHEPATRPYSTRIQIVMMGSTTSDSIWRDSLPTSRSTVGRRKARWPISSSGTTRLSPCCCEVRGTARTVP